MGRARFRQASGGDRNLELPSGSSRFPPLLQQHPQADAAPGTERREAAGGWASAVLSPPAF